jgi:restriction system protein
MTGDDGIDGVIDQDRLGLDAVCIQAKNYGAGRKVGRPDLQKFAGSLEGQRASKGVFIDGPTLARYMYDHGIGVRARKTFDVKRVDEAYFEGDT